MTRNWSLGNTERVCECGDLNKFILSGCFLSCGGCVHLCIVMKGCVWAHCCVFVHVECQWNMSVMVTMCSMVGQGLFGSTLKSRQASLQSAPGELRGWVREVHVLYMPWYKCYRALYMHMCMAFSSLEQCGLLYEVRHVHVYVHHYDWWNLWVLSDSVYTMTGSVYCTCMCSTLCTHSSTHPSHLCTHRRHCDVPTLAGRNDIHLLLCFVCYPSEGDSETRCSVVPKEP